MHALMLSLSLSYDSYHMQTDTSKKEPALSHSCLHYLHADSSPLSLSLSERDSERERERWMHAVQSDGSLSPRMY
jgi:hypothetical protein